MSMGRPRKDIRTKRRTDSGRFVVQFAEDPAHWHTSAETTEVDAIRWARRNRDRLIARAAPRLRELAAGFFDTDGAWAVRMRAKGHSYVDKYLDTRQGHLDNYVIPEFGDTDPREIGRREVDDWLMRVRRKAGGGKPLAGATRNKILNSLAILFEELRDQGVIERSPIDGIRPYSKAPVSPRGSLPAHATELLFPATHGALMRVWGAPLWACSTLVAYETGMRPGEIRALKWEDLHQEIDYQTRASSWAFVVRHGIQAGTSATRKETKNDMVKAGGISERTYQELTIWRAQSKHAADGDFIFTINGRAPVTNEGFLAAFRRGMKEVGLDGNGWTPYWLRHTFVTRALKVLPAAEIAALAGHSVEVSRAYQHPDDDIVLAKSKASRDKLDRAREG